jgi:putative nucleotidyltransferase with HDIG domain
MQTCEELFRRLGEHHPGTMRHLKAVRDLVYALATHMGYNDAHADSIALAAELHDVGKLFIPTTILDAPRALSADEWTVVRAHPLTGAQIARDLGCSDEVCAWIAQHHERLDGSGYYGRKDLPREVSVIAVVDTWDATSASRPYRRLNLAIHERVTIIRDLRVDSIVVDAFLDLIAAQGVKPAATPESAQPQLAEPATA